MTRQANISQNLTADIPSNYSRLIARELDLSARQLPVLLRGTGLGVRQFLREDECHERRWIQFEQEQKLAG
jgi:hypothetical protein